MCEKWQEAPTLTGFENAALIYDSGVIEWTLCSIKDQPFNESF